MSSFSCMLSCVCLFLQFYIGKNSRIQKINIYCHVQMLIIVHFNFVGIVLCGKIELTPHEESVRKVW